MCKTPPRDSDDWSVSGNVFILSGNWRRLDESGSAVLYLFDGYQAAVNSILVILLRQMMTLIMNIMSNNVPAFETPVLLAMVSAGVIGGYI